MDLVRSKYGVIDEKVFKWEKFSSMGNGFTFDLETLIFYAAAVACCEACGISSGDVSVYGDDVILPSVCYDTFCSLCEFLGFKVNTQKSFSSGQFRESCGSHFFGGVDCKPLYLEDALAFPNRVYNFANTLRLRAHRVGLFCDARFRSLFYYLVGSVPKAIRFRISAVVDRKSGEVGPLEGGFISNFDEACPSRAKHGIEGYHVRRLSWTSVKREVDYPGLLLARLSSMAVNSEVSSIDARSALWLRNENPLRGRVKCGLTVTFFRRWYDLGPWI
jgi:hypothetical protein